MQKLEQRTKKYIELHEECVEKIPSLVAVACFFPGRAKDLSAPPRIVRTKEWVNVIDFLALSLKMAAEIACQPTC